MAVSAPAGMSQQLQSGLSKQISEILARPKVKAISPAGADRADRHVTSGTDRFCIERLPSRPLTP